MRDQLAHKARRWQWRWSWFRLHDITQPMNNITYDRSRWVQDDINYFEWLQSTTGHRRCRDCHPKCANSQWKPSELRDQMADKAHCQHWRQWSRVLDHTNKSIERDHQPKHLRLTEWPYPCMWQYHELKAKSEMFYGQHSYDYNPYIWAKCTYPSLRVHLQL